MAKTLADIRAKIAQQESRSSGSGNTRDNAIYPFWDIPEGASTRVRFLPDGDPKNDFFWVERAVIKLPFNGVKGQVAKPAVVQVPCMEMYGETCPILAEVRPWYKDDSLKDMANKYWKKRSYIYQGFVRDNPLNEDNAPENPIRRFAIGPQIHPLILAAIKDPEIEELPTDYERGLDFYVTKTTKPGGTYSDYTTSKWSRKESALTNSERAALDAYGLFNLTDFLPKKPGDAELKAIKEMFEASVNGELYDESRWGQYYRPYGLGGNSSSDSDGDDDVSTSRTSFKPAVAAPKSAETPPWEKEAEVETASAPKGDTNTRAAEILKMIQSRKSS